MSLIVEYLNLHKKFIKQYDENTIILMMVGSFYEMYSVKEYESPDLISISKLLNIAHTRRDKSKPESIGNPAVVGFQMNSLEKFIEILVNNDYNVVVFDQETTIVNNKKVIERKQSGIYTKSTFICNLKKNSNNYLICLYIIDEPQRKSKPLISIGCTSIDLSTGKTYVHSAYSNINDENIALDEAKRFINNMNPSEILIYYDDQTKIEKNKIAQKEYFLGILDVETIKYHYYDIIDPKYKKINYQNEFLKKVYPDCDSMISPIEQLDLEKESNIVVSLCCICDFVYDKIPSLLKCIKEPEFCCNNKHLILGNNALQQLDVFENRQNSIYKIKYKSVFDVVNFTKTSLGERYLRNIMSSPITSIKKLNKIYDLTENMIKNNIPVKLEDYLNSIRDIERLARKMQLKILNPYEICMFISSYENIINIIIVLSKEKVFDDLIKIDKKEITDFLQYTNKIFNIEKLALCTDLCFDKKIEIYNDGIHKDIDKLNNNINSGTDLIKLLRNELFLLFPKTKSKSKIENGGKVLVKHNDKDGYYLSLTDKNAKLLQDKLKEITEIDINGNKIKTSTLEFSYNKKTAKITIPSLDVHTDSLEEYADEISQLYKQHYLEDIDIIYNKFSNLFNQCNNMISYIDYLQSGAKLAKEFNYCKPTINDKEYGYVETDGLRHPIIERLISTEYIPHNITIGHDDFKGMILYGMNCSGKSSIIKSVAISIICAQSGLYVPANKFTYSPYNMLYTRLTGGDNIYKQQSSYMVELVEMNTIIRRSNEKTLVVSDELLSSTEHISAISLISGLIMELAKLKSTFIMTTHIHGLMNIKEVTSIKNVKPYHLSVKYDEKSEVLIYDRTLKKGNGESIYGIEIARYVFKNDLLINNSIKIRNELLKQNNTLLTSKTSNFNSKIYMNECFICKKKISGDMIPLESHHIIPQKDFDENNFCKTKPHIKKDCDANIVPLCNVCHDNIHNNKIEIDGYKMTTKGKKLFINNKQE
jgi:DNA mismatch repair protein MutS